MERVRAEQRCPGSIQTVFYSVARCNLNDRICLLELGGVCHYYEDWLLETSREKHTVTGLIPTWLQKFEREVEYEIYLDEQS
mgnify:CR=1 FL=1